MNTHRNLGKISLPKVKLKNNLNEKRGPFLSTQSTGFSELKRNLINRHASKANIGDHLKHKTGRGGSQFGTVIPQLSNVSLRSRSVVQKGESEKSYNPKRTNRQFMKNTPSISDMDIRKMIGKYPVDHLTAKKGEKEKTVDIIAKINEELNSGNT
jgi:hypothetical protein